MNDARALSRRDHLVGAALCIGYLLLLVGTASDLAMSRDESFYVHAAKNAANWISQIFVDPSSAFAQQSIDRAWRYNWEHPALMKLSFALTWLAQKHLGLFPNESLAFRFPGMLTGALLLWLIYAWGASVMRREGALVRKPGVRLDAEGFLPQPSRLLRHSDRILRHAHRVHVLAVPGRSTLGSLARPVFRLGARYQAQQLDPTRDLPDSFSLDSW